MVVGCTVSSNQIRAGFLGNSKHVLLYRGDNCRAHCCDKSLMRPDKNWFITKVETNMLMSILGNLHNHECRFNSLTLSHIHKQTTCKIICKPCKYIRGSNSHMQTTHIIIYKTCKYNRAAFMHLRLVCKFIFIAHINVLIIWFNTFTTQI